MLDRPCDTGPVEGSQALLSGDGTHEPRVEHLVLGGTCSPIVKIRLNLEQLAEIRIEAAEQIVEEPVAEEDDLNIKRYGFGLKPDRANKPECLPERFDADLA